MPGHGRPTAGGAQPTGGHTMFTAGSLGTQGAGAIAGGFTGGLRMSLRINGKRVPLTPEAVRKASRRHSDA